MTRPTSAELARDTIENWRSGLHPHGGGFDWARLGTMLTAAIESDRAQGDDKWRKVVEEKQARIDELEREYAMAIKFGWRPDAMGRALEKAEAEVARLESVLAATDKGLLNIVAENKRLQDEVARYRPLVEMMARGGYDIEEAEAALRSAPQVDGELGNNVREGAGAGQRTVSPDPGSPSPPPAIPATDPPGDRPVGQTGDGTAVLSEEELADIRELFRGGGSGLRLVEAYTELRRQLAEAKAAVETLVCELPGGTVSSDVAKAMAYGARLTVSRRESMDSVCKERDQARAQLAEAQAGALKAYPAGQAVLRDLAQARADLKEARQAIQDAITKMRSDGWGPADLDEVIEELTALLAKEPTP